MTDLEPDGTSGADEAYASKVGARLRAIRRQKGLSLQDVEAASSQEFKASVLGAYERGERAISVPRLQRLARFYQVPVDRLLPDDVHGDFGARVEGGDIVIDLDRAAEDRPVKIDLLAAGRLTGPQGELLNRYLRMIQVQRGDFNGRMLTVRHDDLRAIACILDVPMDSAFARLDALGVLFAASPV